MNTRSLFCWTTLALSCLCLINTTWLDTTSNEISRANQDYALLFAVDDYANMDSLQNPIRNANEIAAELRDNFDFRVEVVTNPSIDDIDRKLDEYERKFNNGIFDQKGQLFVYFSGHGVAVGNNGYFMTRDANPDRPQRTAMEYDFYRNKINNFACQHIMVAIDACHSATFDPLFGTRSNRRFDRPGEQNFDRVLANHQSYRSRVFWTSDAGGNETPDRSTFALPGRSNFARKLLEGLSVYRSGQPYLTAEELFASYVKRAQPTPNAGDFGKDDPRSSFLFFPKASVNIGDARADYAAWQAAERTNTLPAYRRYLNDYPNGDFRLSATDKIMLIEAEERELSDWQQAKTTNTAEAYSNFLRQHPNSRYKGEAERRQRVADKQGIVSTPATPTRAAADGFVRIEGGTFTMGCQDGRDTNCSGNEKPAHKVRVSSFYLSPYEVTQAEWRRVMGGDPPKLYNKGCDQCPVEDVSWNDVQEFIQKLNNQSGQSYRLPTEAEWEYAARGGNQSKGYLYSGSNDIAEVAWYSNNAKSGNTHGAEKTTRPVGTKAPNELGLYDMSGNVWEWCEDDWHGSYNSAPTTGKAWRDSSRGSLRVLRGGGWSNYPQDCRAAFRNNGDPTYRYGDYGFRLARSF